MPLDGRGELGDDDEERRRVKKKTHRKPDYLNDILGERKKKGLMGASCMQTSFENESVLDFANSYVLKFFVGSTFN